MVIEGDKAKNRIVIVVLDEKVGIFYTKVEGKLELSKTAKKALQQHINAVFPVLTKSYSK